MVLHDAILTHGSLQFDWTSVTSGCYIGAVSGKTACKCFTASILGLYKTHSLKQNVTISNEPTFSDVYRNVNNINVYSLTKLTGPQYESLWGLFAFHAIQCGLNFDKPQKNEIHSFILTQKLLLFVAY